MANVIKLKRGTSTPTTSDIANGEVAIDTSAQKFYVNDSGSIKEIGGGSSSGVGDGDITTAKLADDAVTYAKMQNVSATDRILGRDSSGAGIIEEITPANLRTMINVEDGATADQTASDIRGLGFFDTSNDGSGSGLDSDLLDGQQGSYYLNYNNFSNTPTIPTLTSQLTNNSSFITSSSNISGTSGGFTAGNASNLNSGTISDARLPSSISSDITGNAATATKLATARTIAGTSFDGSANISISYTSLTNVPTNLLTTSSGTAVNASALSNLVLATSGNCFGVVAHIQTDGVMEAGLYIDFHTSDGDTGDLTGGRITGGSQFSFSNGCNAPFFNATSDRSIKNTITDSDLGLDFINKLKPVSFKFNQNVEELKLDAKTHYGLIAQDVEDVITGLGKTLDDISIAVKPEDKTYAGNDRPMAIDYTQLISVLIKSVQELSAKVETLESKVS
tara:strand:+ start:325 stop:1674 length:1350 start_codon:yes stop_codon:yes gene_type:complete